VAIPRQPSSVYRKRTRSAGSGSRSDLAIQIDGLNEFRKALKAVSPEADQRVSGVMRKYGHKARARAKARTPYESGDLETSIRLSVTRKEAALFSNSPYARVHEWGSKGDSSSQVRPRGVPIMILRSQMLGNAVYYYRNALGYELANTVNKAAEANGLDPTPVRQSRYGGSSVINPSN